MKKYLKMLALVLAALCLFPCLMPMAVSAEDEDEEYEKKKAAYREKLKNDDVTSDDILIGSWVSFYSFDVDSYEYQLDQMAAAGINFNIFPRDFGDGSMYDADYWQEVEEQYAKRNMVYLMNGNMRAENVAIGVEYAQGKEHCIGYHVKDEPGGDLLPAIGQQMRAYREADPTRYPFTNLLPSYAGEAWLGGTYREHVQNYVDAVGAENIEYLSHDYYPFRSGNVTMQDIFADMEVMRAVAYENGKLKTHAFPQSTKWNGTRMTDIDEMRWNVYGYLAYGFKALSWFNLVCPGKSDTEGEGFSESLIYRDGQIHDPELFAAWSELNWEIRGLSDILMNADTVHAYHTRKTVKNVEYLPADFYLKPTKTMDFIVSEMESKDGAEKYIMLYNKNLKAKATTSVSFSIDPASGITGIEYFDPFIGEYIKMDISDGILKDEFKYGEGKLYRLCYDLVEETTEETTEETAEEQTTAPETQPETTEPAPEKQGCNSTVCAGAVVAMAAAVGTAVMTKTQKKKKHE